MTNSKVWSDSIAGDNHIITLILDQVQTNTGLFKMPLDIELATLSGDTTFVVWDSLASQTFEFVMNEEVTNLRIDPSNWVLKELLYEERVSVSGTIYGGDESTPLEDAQIYFSRIDLNTNSVVSIDTSFSDAHGQYSIPVIPGFYAIEVFLFEEGYLPATPKFMEITNNISAIDFVLIAPAISTNLDSIAVFLNENESYRDTLKIENIGNGKLLFSIASTTGGGMLNRSSKYIPGQLWKPTIDKLMVRSLENSKSCQELTTPPTSSWQLLYKDPKDNADGIIDINETWMQVSNGNLYLKVTTHHQYGALNQFEYDLFIDIDGNPNTGLFAGWIGADYLIVVSDLGGVYSALVRYVNGNFELVSLATYEHIDPSNNEFTVAFPLSLFGSVKILSMLSVGQSISDPFIDRDVTPDNNFGYFIFGVEDIPWLQIEPNFGIVETSEPHSVVLNIIPETLAAGHYDVNLVIANNEFTNVLKIIPIKFDYITRIAEIENLPKTFSLSQNYPNPFNSETLIHYELPRQGKATLDIYNLLGQKICRLIDKTQPGGSYSINWDGLDDSGKLVGSGIYFYIIKLDNEILPTRKMVIIK